MYQSCPPRSRRATADVVTDPPGEHARRVPVHRHVPDELERRLVGVVLGQVGGHLQRRIEDHVQGELLGQRGAHPRLVGPTRPTGPPLDQDIEDPGREVHWSGQQSREEEDGLVLRRIAAVTTPGVVLLPARSLTAHHVGERAALAGVVHRLVDVQHDAVTRGQLEHPAIVVHHRLGIV